MSIITRSSKQTLKLAVCFLLTFALAFSFLAIEASAEWYSGSFTLAVGGYNVGNGRYYHGNEMGYEVTITNPTPEQGDNLSRVLVQLCKYENGALTPISQRTVGVEDGTVKEDHIPIYDGGYYTFRYWQLGGGTLCRPVKVSMVMYSWYT